MSSADRVVLASRGKAQDPPPWVVWQAIADPSTTTRGWLWFDINPGEMLPSVLTSEKPGMVEWGSIWQEHPDLRVMFEIEPNGSGSFVTWKLLGCPEQLEPSDVKRRQYRLNQLINGRLREYFDC